MFEDGYSTVNLYLNFSGPGVQPYIFQAREVLWNEGTSINIWSKAEEKKPCRE